MNTILIFILSVSAVSTCFGAVIALDCGETIFRYMDDVVESDTVNDLID